MQVPSSCGWSPLSFHTKHRHPPVKAFLDPCSSIRARVTAPDLYTDNIHRDLCTLGQFLMNVWVVYLYQTILLYDTELYCHHTPTWATSYEERCLTPSEGEWIRILYFQQSSPWNSPPCTYTYTPCFLVSIWVGYKRGKNNSNGWTQDTTLFPPQVEEVWRLRSPKCHDGSFLWGHRDPGSYLSSLSCFRSYFMIQDW